eukprot:COSAG04_NODE_2830_length_3521_cov_1.507306_1_plen_180_part_10
MALQQTGQGWAYPLVEPQFTTAELRNGDGLQFCADHCIRLGYNYMGLQWIDSCTCGNEYGSLGPREDGQCGDDGLNCGVGEATCGWTNSVYELQLDASPAGTEHFSVGSDDAGSCGRVDVGEGGFVAQGAGAGDEPVDILNHFFTLTGELRTTAPDGLIFHSIHVTTRLIGGREAPPGDN